MGVLAAIVVALWLTACGGGTSAPEAAGPDARTPALKVSQPGDLTSYVQRVLRERAKQREAGASLSDAGRSVVPLPPGAAAPAAAGTPYSSSLAQEPGVDEPDFVKTDGTHFFSIDLQDASRPLLRTTRRSNAGVLQELAALPLALGGANQLQPRGLVLAEPAAPGAAGSALAVASDAWLGLVGDPCADVCPPTPLLRGPVWVQQRVVVERIDVADAAGPVSSARLEFDGRLVDARRVGNRLVLVSEHQPLLAADQLPPTAAAAERDAAIAATRGADLLPRLRGPGGAVAPLMSDTDCWVQPANASLVLSVTTITVLDLGARDLGPVSRCFVGGTEAMYMTERTLVLASSRWAYAAEAGALRYPPTMRTDLHKFAFASDGALTYRASGEVEGHLGWDTLRKPYRLSEHEGLLRVLSFTGTVGWFSANDAATTPPSPATLSVLREAGNKLEALATLPNSRRPAALGKPGEQVHGVRFVGARGYLVTFRQIDPLYVLDLADAADPRVAGVLEVPGFSDHLVPMSERLLLGVGKAVDGNGRAAGVKVSLFDIADATRPRELAARTFGAAGSQSGLDLSRQGLAMLQQGRVMRLSMPTWLFDANFTSPRDRLQRLEVDLDGGTLALRPELVPAGGATSNGQLGTQRSVLIGEQVVWLHNGRLGAYPW